MKMRKMEKEKLKRGKEWGKLGEEKWRREENKNRKEKKKKRNKNETKIYKKLKRRKKWKWKIKDKMKRGKTFKKKTETLPNVSVFCITSTIIDNHHLYCEINCLKLEPACAEIMV